MTKERLLYLDLVRGIAAWAVFLGHLRSILFPDFSSLKNPSLAEKVFYLCTGLGHQAVIVFFVLSGFFVGGTVVAAKKDFCLKNYLISRLVRLWIVLVPALILTALVDAVIRTANPEILNGIKYTLWNSGPRPEVGVSSSFSTFLGNLFFLQTVICPIFGSNSPLWSLANEFWYYLAFPAFSILFGWSRGKGFFSQKVLAGAFLCFLWEFFPFGLKSGFLAWLMGVGVFCLAKKLPTSYVSFLRFGGFFIFSGALYLSKNTFSVASSSLLPDGIVAIGISLWLLGICENPKKSMPPIATKISELLSESSYTLYVNHFPISILIAAVWFPKNTFFATKTPGILFLTCLVLVSAVCFLMWSLFEKNTQKVRKKILLFIKEKKHF